MNIRDNLYSPLQNASLWIGAWLYGHISIDDADYSLTELFGQGHLVGIGDGNHEIFRILRKNTDLHHQISTKRRTAVSFTSRGSWRSHLFPRRRAYNAWKPS